MTFLHPPKIIFKQFISFYIQYGIEVSINHYNVYSIAWTFEKEIKISEKSYLTNVSFLLKTFKNVIWEGLTLWTSWIAMSSWEHLHCFLETFTGNDMTWKTCFNLEYSHASKLSTYLFQMYFKQLVGKVFIAPLRIAIACPINMYHTLRQLS